MSARDDAARCRTCGQPIHRHRGSATGWQHYPDLQWCDDKAPAPASVLVDDDPRIAGAEWERDHGGDR